jgi:cytochrome c oxidase subunit III
MSIALEERSKIHPYKLALWLGCISMTMLFAAWTSAYIVRQAAGNWYEFPIPTIFFINAGVILLSSFCLHFSFKAFKQKNEKRYKTLLVTGFALGSLFVALQFVGWEILKNSGVPLTKNASGDFFYVLTWFHLGHVLAGITVLILCLIHAFVLPFKVTDKRILRFDLSITFWHFLDLLYIYLLVFFVLQSH